MSQKQKLFDLPYNMVGSKRMFCEEVNCYNPPLSPRVDNKTGKLYDICFKHSEDYEAGIEIERS